MSSLRGRGLGTRRQLLALCHEADEVVAVPVARALEVVAIHVAVVHAVAAAEAELAGLVVMRRGLQHEELVGPGIEARVGRRERGHVLAVRPPEVAAVVRVLVLYSAGAVSVAQEGPRANRRKLEVEGVHPFTPAGFRHATRARCAVLAAIAHWHY